MFGKSNKDVDILHKALATERFAIAAYEIAASSGILSEGVIQVAKTFQEHHGQHAHKLHETIQSLGHKPEKSIPHEEHAKKMPPGLVEERSIIHYALTLEKEATITYLNAIAEITDRKIAQAAASILGDEAMHWAALRNALGLEPVHISFIPLSIEKVVD